MSADLVKRAQAADLLPATAVWPTLAARPWPVVLLTALGAWLVAVPLTVMLMLLLGSALEHGPAAFVIGLLVLGGAVAVLRRPQLPLFVEQLAVPGLLIGGVCLASGLFRSVSDRTSAALLLGLTVLVALAVSQSWLRVLLGALAAALAAFALLPPQWTGEFGASELRPWLVVTALLGLWALALLLQRRLLLAGQRAAWAALVEDLACGWLLMGLASSCWLAGMSFLVGGVFGDARELLRGLAPHAPSVPALGSALLVLLAAWFAQQAWPGLRQWGLGVAAAVLAGLAWLMPSLGGLLFALALLACTGRWRQAAAAGVAVAWVIGSFYYQLQWPLAQKALLLAGAGAVLMAMAALAWPRGAASPIKRARLDPATWGLVAATVLTLAVANGAIWQKEALIAEGRPVFVALAPADPRSLMQGDFMRLNFSLPREVAPPVNAARLRLVAHLDARGVAEMLRQHVDGAPLAADELLLELTPKNGDWILVTDAWFFREGDAARFTAAKFGEFRVLPDGRALLVGLADAQLRPIVPD